jgi:hypothetical protein
LGKVYQAIFGDKTVCVELIHAIDQQLDLLINGFLPMRVSRRMA